MTLSNLGILLILSFAAITVKCDCLACSNKPCDSSSCDADCELGTTESNPATSCQEIYQRNPKSRDRIGNYWISTDQGLSKVTCNMKISCGGIKGGWMQVANVNMNYDTTCPGAWYTITSPKRLCLGHNAGCHSAHFSTAGMKYQHICGQARGYQKGSPDAFHTQTQSINTHYVEGLSITLGSPRKHVWTYAAGLSDDHNYPAYNCPCAITPGPSPPAFVGEHYYCESGITGTYDLTTLHLSDPLWDGSGCTVNNGCCASIEMPWFYRTLAAPVAENFEARLCQDSYYNDEDSTLELLEIYVQ